VLLVPSSLVDLSLRGLRGYVAREGACYWFGREIAPHQGLAMVVAFPRIYSAERSFQLADGQMGQLATWSQREGCGTCTVTHTPG